MGRVYDINELRKSVKESLCFSDVCRLVGVTICDFNIKRIRSLCLEHGIMTEHFDVRSTYRRGKRKTDSTDLVENSSLSRASLRRLLKRLGHYNGTCEICGLGEEWNGKQLTLEIDHINGDCIDNRIENLRWLCPNCHSQTATFKRGKIS